MDDASVTQAGGVGGSPFACHPDAFGIVCPIETPQRMD
jgi:hypothetical protein